MNIPSFEEAVDIVRGANKKYEGPKCPKCGSRASIKDAGDYEVLHCFRCNYEKEI